MDAVDVVDKFPQECRKIIESLAEVYRVDALAKEQQLSDTRRLILHQHADCVRKALTKWLPWNYLKTPERLDTG